MNTKIKFIHLSDIHFTKFSGDQLDLDYDLRKEILRDIQINAKHVIGKADGILVCGDIAFGGQSVEYERAHEFLTEICKILEIPETLVFCVPGNHDVDRDVPKSSQMFLEMQTAIEKATDTDAKLTTYLRDRTGNAMLFKHIDAYNNKFAGKYGCNINESNLYWNSDFTLNDGSILRVVGLNSILISNHLDNDEERLMVLGEYQIPKREEGVMYVTLCHHPPEHWKDPGGIIKNRMNHRVHVQLYGHKHIQKVTQIDNTLVIGSGATHPSRSEKDWKPRYNWVTLTVEGSGDKRILKVSIYPRVLDQDKDSFVCDNENCTGNDHEEYSLNLENWGGKQMESCEFSSEPGPEMKTQDENVIQNNINSPIRTLSYRFLDLSYIDRSSILTRLNLISEEDEGLRHVDLLDKVIQKAQRMGCIHLLWDGINSCHNDGRYNENPFTPSETE